MKNKPIQYVVAWTIQKPAGATTVQMNAGALVDAVTLARDLWVRHSSENITLRVVTPTGGTFLEWSTDA